MENIFTQIRQEEDDFINGFIQPVPGWQFNQYNTIKRAHLYLNSKYEDDSPYLGRTKIFYNIVSAPVQVAQKMLNVDTKDIKLLPTNPKSTFSTFLLEKELKLWLKTSEMAEVLNKIAETAPAYGSVVIEKTPEGADIVDLRRLILDPTADCIDDSRFVTTVHYMDPQELRDTGWENVDVAIERFASKESEDSYLDQYGNLGQMSSSPRVKVYKRYGYVPESFFGGKSEKMIKSLFIVAGADKQEKDAQGKPLGELGVVLFKSKWHKEDWPFKDFHYTKTPGRWLGIGVVEMLFDVQARVNELKNQKRISMELSSMHLFQTRDKSIVRNLLTDLESGDLLISQNGIEPVANEERNLPAFQDEEMSYMGQVDRLSFAYEAIRGSTEDQGQVTLGQTQIAVSQGTSVYAFKKQNLTIMLRDFFNELVLPQLMKDLTPEHIMRFVGTTQELDKIDLAASEIDANDAAKEAMLSGRIITREMIEQFKADRIKAYKKQGEARWLKIKDAFYDDVEFEFDFVIGNEQVDPMRVAQATQAVFMALAQAQNPQGGNALLDDPRIKVLFDKYAQSIGVSTAEMEIAQQQKQQMPQQAPLPQLPSPQTQQLAGMGE